MTIDLAKWIPLLIGGLTGTFFRYILSGAIFRWFGSSFPYGTLTVNTLGCLLLGFFAIAADKFPFFGPHSKLLLTVGFCGAFTTFSTFILETTHLMRDGHNFQAFMNISFSILLGFLALKIGIYVGDLLT